MRRVQQFVGTHFKRKKTTQSGNIHGAPAIRLQTQMTELWRRGFRKGNALNWVLIHPLELGAGAAAAQGFKEEAEWEMRPQAGMVTLVGWNNHFVNWGQWHEHSA
ncbi:UNVERIFIED_CONTAM: hypothetical protein K2H54_004213 [Gekko kuhli]